MKDCVLPLLFGTIAGNATFWVAAMIPFRFRFGFKQSEEVDRKTAYITKLEKRILDLEGKNE